MTNEPFALSYNFTCEELKSLASVIRKNQDKIPMALRQFAREVQNKVYACMSIDEVEECCKNEKF